MRLGQPVRFAGKAIALVLVAGATGYAGLVLAAWYAYGRADPPAPEEADPLLDRFMPRYEVVERHHVRIDAPAPVVLAAARRMDLMQSGPIRTIIDVRARVLGAKPDNRLPGRGLLADMEAIGWRVLAEVPDRELVVGAATRPWEANVTFRPLSPEQFSTFNEPGYVKIAWTLRADPDGPNASVFRTETRVQTTDADARKRFRRYWSFVSPGIVSIRWLLLGPLKAAAEGR